MSLLEAEEINKMARLLGCQFIIATHSPFMLGTLRAKIYNLDTKECRFDTDEVAVNRIGDIVILMPKTNKWSSFMQAIDMFSDDFESGDICISSVTYAELVHGVEKSKAVEKNRVALALLLANIEIMNFHSYSAEQYGKIRADLEKAGTPIGPLDMMMIAGHAMSLGYTVVTNNTKEFERVIGL